MTRLVLAVLLMSAIPAASRAQTPPDPRGLEALDAALAEVRVLRAVNGLQLSREQGSAVLQRLDEWDRQRSAVHAANEEPLRRAAAALRAGRAQVEADPARQLPAEAEYERLV